MLKELLQDKLDEIKPEKFDEDMGEPFRDQFPNLHLDSDNLSEIKDWENGGEYMIVMRVKQRKDSKRMHTENDIEKWSASFDIREIGVLTEEDLDHGSSHNSGHSSLKKKYGG